MNTAIEFIYHLSPYVIPSTILMLTTMWFERKGDA